MAGNDLGNLLGQVLGGGQSGQPGQGGQGGGAGKILGALIDALNGPDKGAPTGNPLSGLLDKLGKSGLVEQAQSWIGTGENKPVSGAQIEHALPTETLTQVAQQTGVSPTRAAEEIAHSLPTAVDRLTPEGELPRVATMEDLIKRQHFA
ncbi:YidB family protein [Streptomyces sp. NPDC048664]|uniref:YidB family protein n=1 Tax=Streptomyces sp. NPDC048664 TaxID=3154505 RepID=UPI00342218F2